MHALSTDFSKNTDVLKCLLSSGNLPSVILLSEIHHITQETHCYGGAIVHVTSQGFLKILPLPSSPIMKKNENVELQLEIRQKKKCGSNPGLTEEGKKVEIRVRPKCFHALSPSMPLRYVKTPYSTPLALSFPSPRPHR